MLLIAVRFTMQIYHFCQFPPNLFCHFCQFPPILKVCFCQFPPILKVGFCHFPPNVGVCFCAKWSTSFGSCHTFLQKNALQHPMMEKRKHRMPPFLNFAPTAFQRHLEHSDRSPSQWIKIPGGIIPIAKVLLFFPNQSNLFHIIQYF